MSHEGSPQSEIAGEVYWVMSDPVLIASASGEIEALNPAAESLFAISSEEASAPGFEIESIFGGGSLLFLELLRSGGHGLIDCSGGSGLNLDVTVVARPGDDRRIVVTRNVTEERNQIDRLLRLNRVARELSTVEPLEAALQFLVDEARRIVPADFSALLLLRPDSDTEIERFVYNAPRELFPRRLPRAVGLLAVPVKTRAPARLDDIRGHPEGVGIPVEHPPIGPLLAVPLVTGDEVLGELAVANEVGGRPFDELDELLLSELGLHAAESVRLSRSRDAELAAETARRTMIDVLRHDIATPIAVTKGVTQQLRERFEEFTPEERDRLFDAVARSVQNLERLSVNLRSDARLEDPALEASFVDVPVDDVLTGLEQTRDLARQRGVELHLDRRADAPIAFKGSPLLATQALSNLVINAIQHSKQGTAVTVTARREGNSVRFDVTDQGPGLPEDVQSGLFRRFNHADAKQSGLGLGLSIVKRVAEAHGGNVGVTSRPGQGATFWITFPER